ncbi:IclR family transcriptional regulator [Halogeometricum borinquense]|uniref:Transcriptional regulator n=2 Tax=Halogeometricum borinquense TaxID=60847 RepID=E4NV73_HALBP|nr:IclR family transcriptional regulator [Halogeometricum borinquense]ADQ69062.1 transcriptional regulator [Halogeometricum borinquense DSM 11551]ELY29437.1 transcriptional regulator [Halogeometricum borinquense DSM 11551]QIB74319.1 IclR family transcriptional regulator [Halogeometricum borinquense]RYJ08229.1 IclR family transcriptional regulator [Halogeometricum borinquense]
MINEDNGGVPDTVQSARTLFDVLQCVKEDQGKTVSEVSDDLEYARSTVHRHLRTLEDLGYLIHRPDGYHVGLKFLDLGVSARDNYVGYDLIREKVEEIAETTGERCQFFVEEHAEAVYLARSVGEHAVQTDPGLGSRIPLYAASAGKAILAELPEQELSEYIEQVEFEQLTENTITDPAVLRDELAEIRERGYGFNRQETVRGTHAVGVAVTAPEGGAIGGLSVTGPSHRLKGDQFENVLPNLLLGAANELELNIAFS